MKTRIHISLVIFELFCASVFGQANIGYLNEQIEHIREEGIQRRITWSLEMMGDRVEAADILVEAAKDSEIEENQVSGLLFPVPDLLEAQSIQESQIPFIDNICSNLCIIAVNHPSLLPEICLIVQYIENSEIVDIILRLIDDKELSRFNSDAQGHIFAGIENSIVPQQINSLMEIALKQEWASDESERRKWINLMYSLCVRREMQIISAIESNRGIIKKREELFYQQLSGCLQQLSVYNEIYDLLNSSDISSRRLGKRKLIDYKEKFESGNITVDQPLGFQGDAYQKYWDYVELEFIKCVNDTNIKPYAIGQGVYIK